MEFTINATSNNARACTIVTAHSTIETPVFMPVGTQGTVKALDANDMLELGAKIILGNTYHLYLRPGSKLVKKFGGLHGFSKFPNSFLTDSGGFQAFSLSDNSKPDENGIMFKSHIDGSKHYFTPKSVLDTQYDLNSDIMMILDDLVALPNTKERISKSIERAQKKVERYADDLLLMTPMLWDKTILEPGAKLSKVTIDVHLATFGYPKKIEEGVSL